MNPPHLAVTCEALTSASVVSEQAGRLAKFFVERGCRVSVLTAKGALPHIDDRVQVHSADQRKPGSMLGIMRFRRWHAQQLAALKPDHTLSLTTLISSEVLIPLEGTAAGCRDSLRQLSAPLPVRIGAWLQTLTPGLMMREMAERRTLADAGLRVCAAITPVIAKQLSDGKRAAHVQIETVAPPLHNSDMDTSEPQDMREHLARGLDLPGDVPWLIFPFRSGWVAGIEPMVLAFKALIDRGSDAVLLLAGPWRYTHLAWIGQLGLRDRVRFMGEPDLPEQLYAAADLIVQPTSYDPGGWVARRAMACGLPVVTSAVSGAADLIKEGGGEVLAHPVDAQRLKEAIQSLLSGISPGSPAQTGPPKPAPGTTPPAFLDVIEALLALEPSVPGP